MFEAHHPRPEANWQTRLSKLWHIFDDMDCLRTVDVDDVGDGGMPASLDICCLIHPYYSVMVEV